jgi:hypothetical protein
MSVYCDIDTDISAGFNDSRYRCTIPRPIIISGKPDSDSDHIRYTDIGVTANRYCVIACSDGVNIEPDIGDDVVRCSLPWARGWLSSCWRLFEIARRGMPSGTLATFDIERRTFDIGILRIARRSREVKAGIPCSYGAGRRGFYPCQPQRTKLAFFPPLAT